MKQIICFKFYVFFLLTLCCIAKKNSAHADYTAISDINGIRRIELIRPADIKPECSYRIASVLSTTKNNTYNVNFISQSTDNNPIKFILEGQVTRDQAFELSKNTAALLVNGQPLFLPTPVANPTYAIRLSVDNNLNAQLSLVVAGKPFLLNTAFFELQRECALASPIKYSGSTEGCGNLGFKDIGGRECLCAYNTLTNGQNTVCSHPDGTSRDCIEYFSGPNASRQLRCFGPVDPGFHNAYVFDSATCSCLFCDPAVYSPSADQRSCQCRYTSIEEVIKTSRAGQEWPFISPPPYTVPYELAQKCSDPRAYFDAASCDCKICPINFNLDATRTHCS